VAAAAVLEMPDLRAQLLDDLPAAQEAEADRPDRVGDSSLDISYRPY
jgi:hypothetical protein